MPSNEVRIIIAKLEEINGKVPEDLKERILATNAGLEAFIRGISLQIDSHELLTLLVIETGSPVMISDMDQFARDVTNELLKPAEVTA